jgi:hypothetical protein
MRAKRMRRSRPGEIFVLDFLAAGGERQGFPELKEILRMPRLWL